MLHISQSAQNTIYLDAYDLISGSSPYYYVLGFKHDISNTEISCSLTDVSNYPTRYLEFQFNETTGSYANTLTFAYPGLWTYKIYQGTSGSLIMNSTKLLGQGKAFIHQNTSSFGTFVQLTSSNSYISR